MEEKKKCSGCSSYRRDVRRCALGKINPLKSDITLDDINTTASIFGYSYFCQITEGQRARVQKAIAKKEGKK